jgi:hypothetical protein
MPAIRAGMVLAIILEPRTSIVRTAIKVDRMGQVYGRDLIVGTNAPGAVGKLVAVAVIGPDVHLLEIEVPLEAEVAVVFAGVGAVWWVVGCADGRDEGDDGEGEGEDAGEHLDGLKGRSGRGLRVVGVCKDAYVRVA